VAAERPQLLIAGHPAIHWARQYVEGSRGKLTLDPRHCGIGNERLAFRAVRAAITMDLSHVNQFLVDTAEVPTSGDFPDELLYGRAGTLYMLRMMRHWVPDSPPLVQPHIDMITRKIVSRGPAWKWHGQRYLGAVHGDIGILTQIILTSPNLASKCEEKLDQLLDMQLPDGNWPVCEGDGNTDPGLVQFCHGAPGFVVSLLALRLGFPNLHVKIDAAIQNARRCIWEKGLLRKAPNLCHGIFGNAL
jgi:hypothetical protein